MNQADIARERAAQDRKRKLAQEQRAEDTKWLMSHAQGRRLMWAMLSELGLYRTPFVGENNKTNFNLGEHNAALRLHSQLLEHAPDECDLMAREARTPPKQRGRAFTAEKHDYSPNP
jgi:hypothetical protein